ncbi:MFS transporter [Pseudomonas sp. A014]|uniref:MFS transporter n=1 Tax=Pseudomonas sp. A014 TaxID=3458058 RepID=UPI00403601E3
MTTTSTQLLEDPSMVASASHSPRHTRRVVIAGAIGTVIEYFDFSVYAFLATILAVVFFPAQDPTAGLLYTLGVFGVAFVARPLGGILIGHISDRYGRKPALATAVIGMAFASTLIGLLPGYLQIGIAAPILLFLLRCVQGISAGGELGSAGAYVAEVSPDHRRGFLTSTTQVGTMIGTMLGSLSVALLHATLSHEDILAWGWRIPFLVSLPMGVLALWVRHSMEESQQFEQLEERGAIARVPALAALRSHPGAVFKVFGLTLVSFASYYLVFTYLATYFEKQGIMPPGIAAWSTTLTLALAAVAVPVWGGITDRIGRRPLLIGVCVANLLLAYPLFLLMQTSVAGAVVGQVLLGQIEAAYLGVILAAYCEMFPARVRSSGLSLGYNLSAIAAGGSAPYLATLLISITGNPLAPSWILICTALLSLLVACTVRETANRPMPTL